MKTMTVLAGAAVAVLLTVPVDAQIKVGTKVGETPVVTSGSYDSLGRRDPFMSLITARRPAPGTPVVPRTSKGLGSFMLADVVVTGITHVTEGELFMAILQGPDKQSYVAKVKDKIADAVIKSIDRQGVVFVDIPGLGSTIRPQETRKVLRSAAEVNR